jgi:hypothetical protein
MKMNHPPSGLKNGGHLRENVATFDEKREGGHIPGDYGGKRPIEVGHGLSVEDGHDADSDWGLE